ncbi:DUF4231 domain-containing protein [Vibrio aestuarianus]|uniref:DUF4231 domain-containing protein n=1 Tax=Vibrio aestuarianus TaxID=28171 RepID=A0ABD7YRH5_9VIBR|nr:DUF4231 domain-containing protein [Vibrio aestuarianus]WGK87369.1 DUF4231 domain-containing protein [Vibrio aestuarianus]CAH8239170.1 hypothetical protein VAEU17_5480001 [Vibrio aestuarianus]
MKNDKYEFLYSYSRSAFDEEILRFKNLEEKASRFISLYSILIAAFTAVITASVTVIMPLNEWYKWLILCLIVLTYVSFVSSWSFLFRALKFTDMPRLPLDDNFISEFRSRDLVTNHYALSLSCSNALELARETNAEKSKLLQKSHKEIALSVWLLTLSLGALSLTKIVELNMPENENVRSEQTTQTQQGEPAQPEPDFDVTAPKVVFVMDEMPPELINRKDSE